MDKEEKVIDYFESERVTEFIDLMRDALISGWEQVKKEPFRPIKAIPFNYKRGRMLTTSYKAVEFQKADLLLIVIKQIGIYIAQACDGCLEYSDFVIDTESIVHKQWERATIYVLYNTKEDGNKRNISDDDLKMINKLSRYPVSPNDVYTFKISLCNNDIDKDFERLTAQALVDLSTGFIGIAGIQGNGWLFDSARIYKTELAIDRLLRTKAGDVYCKLIGYAFIPYTNKNQELINHIETVKNSEVSIGCSVSNNSCSICGAKYDKCEHKRGETYDNHLCFVNLEGVKDIYEWALISL